MGYLGAAWAASLYNGIYSILVVPALIYMGEGWLFRFEGIKKVMLDYQGAYEYLRLAIPGTLQTCLEWWALEIVSLMAGLLPNPQTTIGASYIAYNLESVLVMVWVGILVASAIRVGEHVGAGHPKRAKNAAILGVTVALILGIFLGLVLYLAKDFIVTLYSNDEDTRAVASRLMTVLAVVVVFDACNNAAGGVLNGLGLQRWAATFQLMGYYVVGTPTAAIAVFAIGVKDPVMWVWGGVGLAMACSSISAVVLLSRHQFELSVRDAEERLRRSMSPEDRLLHHPPADGDDDMHVLGIDDNLDYDDARQQLRESSSD
eukprot:CAMPEP_0167773786 /NCGR_PEP_ID=MMETSP0111_2-20121227/1628_1 /TAXON_ID=91324 /ORGANISM="Lotharella globosa, Strain CCCM811" /LENGTH=316 /DNA_ID=CAMNT_0007663491 /DNA_START=338 /DNA_END=1288 /DNA_ORIENTATION=-